MISGRGHWQRWPDVTIRSTASRARSAASSSAAFWPMPRPACARAGGPCGAKGAPGRSMGVRSLRLAEAASRSGTGRWRFGSSGAGSSSRTGGGVQGEVGGAPGHRRPAARRRRPAHAQAGGAWGNKRVPGGSMGVRSLRPAAASASRSGTGRCVSSNLWSAT